MWRHHYKWLLSLSALALISALSIHCLALTTEPISTCSFTRTSLGLFATSSRDSSSDSSISNQIHNSLRGDRYGADHNSTIPTPQQAAASVGVRPTANVSAAVWKRAWNFQKQAIPLLHAWDPHKPPDSDLALSCLWWKALAANDVTSPVFDDSLAYDLLPRYTRLLVQPGFVASLYPRLHHANVEIRTAFLDQAVTDISRQYSSKDCNIRLVSLGAGYDVRSIKMLERGVIDAAVELDLQRVIDAKRRILESERFRQRRPHGVKLPAFFPVDLNEVEQVQKVLKDILLLDKKTNEDSSSDSGTSWHTIFLFEGVMIYLKEGVPEALLDVCRQALETTGQRGSLCFADRLENIPGGDLKIAKKELEKHGWNLTEWKPKPGLARHMGSAKMMEWPNL